jgi:Tol biopolymer transport system component/subtilase family serine protease/fibronectin type 3 domain-containing protein
MPKRVLGSGVLIAAIRPLFSTALLTLLLFCTPSLAAAFTAQQLGDYGNVSVMEVTGNFDAHLPDGTTNAEPRRVIAKEFYKTHKDEYDFLIIFTDFDFLMPDAETAAFYVGIKNDVQGIGSALFDYSSSYGSAGRLQGTVDMGTLADNASDPTAPQFENTLDTLNHELLHRWGARVKYQDTAGKMSTALIGKDGSHWSFLLDTKGSLEYGNRWQDNGDGTFTSIEARKYFSPLDLYLMGMVDAGAVPPMLLIENPQIDPTKISEVGAIISGVARTVTIEDIIAAEGPRIPSAADSQKSFKAAFIYATSPGTFNGKDLRAIENIRNGFLTRYSILTDGESLVQVAVAPRDDLPTNPGITPPFYIPRSQSPSVDDGIAWLLANQKPDGSWVDTPETMPRDTAEAVTALNALGSVGSQLDLGMTWLGGSSSFNSDFLARKIEALLRAGRDAAPEIAKLVSRQNPDGGWGLSGSYVSDSTDTALVLRVLGQAGYSNTTMIAQGIDYLTTHQNADGGWSSDRFSSLIQPTANALVALNYHQTLYPLGDSIAQGVAFLKSKQNPDGGFGNSPSTVYDSAAALLAMNEVGLGTGATGGGVSFLLGQQAENGSWHDSPYQTAVAVQAISLAGDEPDLSIEAADITFTPERIVKVPSNAVVNVKVWNQGRSEVPQAKVILYKGDVAEANKIGEQTLAFPGLSSVVVTFAVSLVDWREQSFTVVVDPDDFAAESNEDNNRAEQVLLLDDSADFQILPGDIFFSPESAISSEAVAVSIANLGLTDGSQVKVVIYDGTTKVGEQWVDLPALSSVSVNFPIHLGDGKGHPFTVIVDPDNRIKESNESNNKAETVLSSVVVYDFEISPADISVEPNPADFRDDMRISARIFNRGSRDAFNVQVRFSVEQEGGVFDLSTLTLDIPAGTAATGEFVWSADRVGVDLPLSVQVDPFNGFQELSETNNRASVPLTVNPPTQPNLTVSHNDLVIVPDPANERGSATISALVKNNGFSTAQDVRVAFYLGVVGNGAVMLGSHTIPTLGVGESAPVTLDWPEISEPGGGKVISVVVDPENLIGEVAEEDNEAFRTLQILSLPDLVVEPGSIDLAPGIPKEGDAVEVMVTVLNRGDQTAENVIVNLLEGEIVIGSRLIARIGGNSQAETTFIYDATDQSGSHVLNVVVDPDSLILEQSEDNNLAVKTFIIQNSDNWVSESYISPNGDGVQDTTTFGFRMEIPVTVVVAVLNDENQIVRLFRGEEFENTTGGSVLWDGLNEREMVVDDGVYQLQILDEKGNVLGEAAVVVDNNRSLFAEAIGTPFLLHNNLTCALPDDYYYFGENYFGENFKWLPDESGLLFSIWKGFSSAEFPAAVYVESPYGDDIRALVPEDWLTSEDPTVKYTFGAMEASPDGRVIALVRKRSEILPTPDVYGKPIIRARAVETWFVDPYGQNLRMVASQSMGMPDAYHAWNTLYWSPDSHTLVYALEESLKNYSYQSTKMFAINSDGSDLRMLAVHKYVEVTSVSFSADSSRIAYLFPQFRGGTEENGFLYGGEDYRSVWTNDLHGGSADVFVEYVGYNYNPRGEKVTWAGDRLLLFDRRSNDNYRLSILDLTGSGNHTLLSNKSSWYFETSPSGNDFVFVEHGAKDVVYLNRANGDMVPLHDTIRSGPSDHLYTESGVLDLQWSPDGRRISFVDRAYELVSGCDYNAYLVSIDTESGDKTAHRIADAESLCRYYYSSYHIYLEEKGIFNEKGILHYDATYADQEVNLGDALAVGQGSLKIKIVQSGMDEAQIDFAAVKINGRFYSPATAVNTATGENVLDRLAATDDFVLNAHGLEFELGWENLPQQGRASLVLNANEVDLKRRPHNPFRYPVTGQYTVVLGHDSPLELDGRISAEDKLPAPLFKTYSKPVTGHPPGFVYGYVKNDDAFLYATLDFTVDNTLDSERDWASLEIMTASGAKNFLIRAGDETWGRTTFSTTESVPYPHKVYEFKIPLSELGAHRGDELALAFSAYGSAGGSSELTFYEGGLAYLPDSETMVGSDNHGVFAINVISGQRDYLPIEGELAGLSPKGNYINYVQPVDVTSPCFGHGYKDIWSLRSALNLVADLSIRKEKSFVALEGVAADLSFAGYKLEYADAGDPTNWTLVQPASTWPVFGDLLGTWIPPQEGTYFVQLTVWDKAGNLAWDRERVSWGNSSSITSLYKSFEIFSPNNDTVKDEVELRYRVLEPVHLVFSVMDDNGRLIRTIERDHQTPGDNLIRWDGRNEFGQVVADGIYTFQVFDYRIAVEVDNTPPQAVISLTDIFEKKNSLMLQVTASAEDRNFESWQLERGVGENPSSWVKVEKPSALLGKQQGEWTYVNGELADLARNKFRIVALDRAGNRATAVSELVQERLLLLRVFEQSVSDGAGGTLTIAGQNVYGKPLGEPGSHELLGLDTNSVAVKDLRLEYRLDDKWFDASASIASAGSGYAILWNNGPVADQVNTVRLRGLAATGETVYSNILIVREVFYIKKADGEMCPAEYWGVDYLYEDLVQYGLQFNDQPYGDWSAADTFSFPIPRKGEFALPVFQGGKYMRMVGTGIDSGHQYQSEPIEIEQCPGTGPNSSLEVVYPAGECGSISGTVELEIESLSTVITGTRYYLEKDGEFSQLSETYFSTLAMAEGIYPVMAEGEFFDPETHQYKKAIAFNSVTVDRQLPEVRITHPAVTSPTLCPQRMEGGLEPWYGLPIEAIIADNLNYFKWSLYYGPGLNPQEQAWKPVMTKAGQKPGHLTGEKKSSDFSGLLGWWDVSTLEGGLYTVKLSVEDSAGNVECHTVAVSFERATVSIESDNELIFSPNGDGISDQISVTYNVGEIDTVNLMVYSLLRSPDLEYILGAPVRVLASGLQHLGASNEVSWDGMNDANAIVPDGLYAVAVEAADPCGNAASAWVAAEVDNTPPHLAIDSPRPTDKLGTIVEIRGTVEDVNLKEYLFDAGPGADPETWMPIASKFDKMRGLYAVWNTFDFEGLWTLRLIATDSIGNRSETRTTVDLGQRTTLIKSLSVNPRIFSPNADGRLDHTDIQYEVTEPCQVLIEFLDEKGDVAGSTTATNAIGGNYDFRWNGQGNTGALVADGLYDVRVTATLANDPAVTQTETLSVIVDTILPVIDIPHPVEDAFLNQRALTVAGSIDDLSLSNYLVTYAGPLGEATLDAGTQVRSSYAFGTLRDLEEETYLLIAVANDMAENQASVIRRFTIDRTAPLVSLETPKNVSYYGSTRNLIAIEGAVIEKNLAVYSLRYGVGENPVQWTELVGGPVVPTTGPGLFVWDVGGGKLADGTYTLSLYAKDKAGLEGEVRALITVDNTPPEVVLSAPLTDGYIIGPTAISGTASDLNLDKWLLEIAEGTCASAYKWSPFKTDTVSVLNGELASWQALPASGDYCLRLSAADKVGSRNETTVTVRVDTLPPQPPLLSGVIDGGTVVHLDWTAGAEPDLAGYNLYRDQRRLNADPLPEIVYEDSGLPEGRYVYAVRAVDLAGNESDSSTPVELTIDLTGPVVGIASPQDSARVRDLVDIRGAAYGSDDFREYRIFIGAGNVPEAWTLIRKSPVPTSFGLLARWDTLGYGDGTYIVKLEAEDLSGNISSKEIAVTLDNQPPQTPVLLAANASISDVSLVWEANTDSDLAGYLLYRNDRLANVESVVIGDLKPYLVVATDYVDQGLVDGRYRYHLLAMDGAGNLSEPSNGLELTIDTRPPQAVIVEPLDGVSLENRIMVRAESVDSDIASTLFQYRSPQQEGWTDIAEPMTGALYAVDFSPESLGLVYGDYQLRAVATDLGGKIDPAPLFVTITYADLTAPAVPVNLQVRVTGEETSLTWNANAEADLAGYNIYRSMGGSRIRLNSGPVQEAAYAAADQADGAYLYEITAVDVYENESAASVSVPARIYTPRLVQPHTPTSALEIPLEGDNVEPGAAVEISRETTAGAASMGTVVADEAGHFILSALSLAPGENRITVKATDVAGNTSKVSALLVVVHNLPPQTPRGFAGSATGYSATLSWDPNPESDLAGYNLYRDGERINNSVPMTLLEVSASSTGAYSRLPETTRDGDPATYWQSASNWYADAVWFELALPQAELVSSLDIQWRYAGADYEVQAWTGYAWLPLAQVTGNALETNHFDFDPPYRTDRVRVYVTEFVDWSNTCAISEIGLGQARPIDSVAYDDLNLTDRLYEYQVTAVDAFGFESPPATTTVVVGDLIPPAAPGSLIAAAHGSDVLLDWCQTPNTEADLAGYNVYRQSQQEWILVNGEPLSGTVFTDAAMANGIYRYRLTAVDLAGNESAPSPEASAQVSVVPPAAPINLTITPLPEGGALGLTWELVGSDAASLDIYRGIASGGPYQKVGTVLSTETSWLDGNLANGTTYYYVVVAVDSVGNESEPSLEGFAMAASSFPPSSPVIWYPALPGMTKVVLEAQTDIAGYADPGASVKLFQDGTEVGVTLSSDADVIDRNSVSFDGFATALSPSGRYLTFVDGSDLLSLLDLSTRTVSKIVKDGWFGSWAPTGERFVYGYFDENGYLRLGIYDIATGSSVPLAVDSNLDDTDPFWTMDGSGIVFVSDRGGFYDVWLMNVETGTLTQLTDGRDAYFPQLSADGEKVSFFEYPNLFVVDLSTGSTMLVDSNIAYFSMASWSPDSREIAYFSDKNGNGDLYTMEIATATSVQLTDSALWKFDPSWSPDGLSVLYGQEENDGSYSMRSAGADGTSSLVRGALENLGFPHWNSAGEIVFLEDGAVSRVVPKGTFRLENVPLHSGENVFYAVATDASGNQSPASEAVAVVFDTSFLPDVAVSIDDLFVYPLYPRQGETVVASVAVRNLSKSAVENVEVILYLWDASGNLQLLKEATLPLLAPFAEETVSVSLNAGVEAGANSILVLVDPKNSIEELLESNNYASREFYVTDQEAVLMSTNLNAEQYGSHQDVGVEVTLRNSGRDKEVTLEMTVEDDAGPVVASLDPVQATLPYGSSNSYTRNWNTEGTFAGSYRLRAVLKDTTGILEEQVVSFVIVPELNIQTVVATDRAVYGPNERVTVSTSLKNLGRNYVVPNLKVRTTVLDAAQQDLFVAEQELQNLSPGMNSGLQENWQTGLVAPGEYRVLVEAYLGDSLTSSAMATFTVKPALVVVGTIAVDPAVVSIGSGFKVPFTLGNGGNVDADGVVRVSLVDPGTLSIIAEEEQVISVQMNGSQAGIFAFLSQGLELKSYRLDLRFVAQAEAKLLASTSLGVKDGTAPVATIVSPVPDETFNAVVNLDALATDNASGVEKVEYRIDDGEWRLMPFADLATGRYSLRWEPTIADAGPHVFGLRATDRAGNVSTPVPVAFTIQLDNVPPVTTIELGAPSYQTSDDTFVAGQSLFTLKAVDNFSGIAATEVRLDNGSWTPYAPFTLSGLADGSHAIGYRSADGAGNVEPEQVFHVILDSTQPVTAMVTGQPQFVATDGAVFVTSTTGFGLTSVDEYCGVAATEYRVDGGKWTPYAPINLTGVTDGIHTLGYRSVDRLGHLETEQVLTVILDNQVPETTSAIDESQYLAGDTLFVTGTSLFTLGATDSLSGVSGTEFRIDGQIWATYAPFALAGLADGEHVVNYRSNDNVGNAEVEHLQKVVLDNSAPVTVLAVGDPQFLDNVLYVNSATEFLLSASDDLAGIAATIYQINDEVPVTGTGPFTLAGLPDGSHTVSYWSVDNMTNRESTQTLSVVIDNAVPESALVLGGLQVTSSGTLYVSGATTLTLSATDNLSGVAATEYRIDNGVWSNEAVTTLAGLTDDKHVIGYRSWDNVTNLEVEKVLPLVVDNTAPVTSIAVGEPQVSVDGNLYISGVTGFTLSASDNLSGVANTLYRIDGGPWAVYAPFTLAGLDDGEHTIGYHSTDNSENSEQEQTLVVVVESTPPETRLDIVGPQYGVPGSLYVADTTAFTLIAEDQQSGVAATEYRIDGGAWTPSEPFTLTGLPPGEHTIGYRSANSLGEVETEKVVRLILDTTAPVTAISAGLSQFTDVAGTLYVNSATTFSLTAADPFSGVAASEYRLDDGAWEAYLPFTVAGEGSHTIEFRSTDNLGYMEVEKSLTVMVDNSPPETRISFSEQSFLDGETILVSPNTEVALSAVDNLAGIQGIYYRLDDETLWRTCSGSFTIFDLESGTHTIHYRSVDNVGNTEAERTVTVAFVEAEVDTRLLNLPRVLIWTEDPGKNRDDHDDRGDNSDKDDDDDHDGDDDHRIRYTLDEVKAFLGEALGDPDIYYTVTTDKDDFRREFCSGIYNMTVILAQQVPFDEPFLREMREGVHRGMGLLVSGWGSSVHPTFEDVFGVKFKGSLSENEDRHPLYLYASPLSSEEWLTVYGRILKTDLEGGTLAGVIPGKEECEGVRSVAFAYPLAIAPGDRLQVTLGIDKGKKRVTVDEEWLTVGNLPGGLVNRSTGNTSGDLAILTVTAEGPTLAINSPYGHLEEDYTLNLTLERSDGSRSTTGSVSFAPTCDARLAPGVKVGPLTVLSVEEDRVKEEADLPAVVLNSYGLGNAAFFAYDLLESAMAGDAEGQGGLLRAAANYLLPEQDAPQAGGVALIENRIRFNGREMDLLAVEQLGDGVTYIPLFDLTRDPLEFSLHLTDGEEAAYRYFVRFADGAGVYGKETELYLNLKDGVTLFGSYPAEFTVGDDSETLLQKALLWVEEHRALVPSGCLDPDWHDDKEDDNDDDRHDSEGDHQDGEDQDNNDYSDCEGGDDGLEGIFDDLTRIETIVRSGEQDIERVIQNLVTILSRVEKLPVEASELRNLLAQSLRILEGEGAFLP